MAEISINTNDPNTTSHNYGKKLYATNKTLRDIATIMEHPEFKEFFDKYFENPLEAKTMLMMMKLYRWLPNLIDIPSNSEVSSYTKIAFLKSVIDDSILRAQVSDIFNKWLADNEGNITSLLDKKNTSLSLIKKT
jgi:hypothetical protein